MELFSHVAKYGCIEVAVKSINFETHFLTLSIIGSTIALIDI